MKKQVIAMVLVGGRGKRLGKITQSIAKPAVTFGGKYRLIDFVLSNLSNSNIDTAGFVTQYEPHELMNYIGLGSTWDLDSNEGGVQFLTPYTTLDGDLWQKGTAHAIMQHMKYIDHHNPDYVLILGGDHIYKMDYNEMIEEHINNHADITIGTFPVTKDASRYGIVEINATHQVIGFEEKPAQPKSNLASMGIYVFNTSILRELLAINEEHRLDFGHDIVPLALANQKSVYAFRFNGYFRDVGTVESLYKANMELIDNPQFLKLHEYVDSPVYTKSSNLPPHHIGEKCIVKNSLISDGSLILGDVYHSILSSRVVVLEGSLIRDSIIYQDVTIGKGVTLTNVIILSGTTIPDFTMLECKDITIIDNDYIEEYGDCNE
jgi:glucose-1-phosphate adenylyltransferase